MESLTPYKTSYTFTESKPYILFATPAPAEEDPGSPGHCGAGAAKELYPGFG